MSTIFGIICWIAGFFYLYRFLKDDFDRSVSSHSQHRQVSKTATKAKATARKAKPTAKPSTATKPKSAKKSPLPKKKTTAKAPATKTDDLTRINGIGPKIAVFLNSKGIKSYLRLAKFDPAKLSGLLQKEGIRVRENDPQMWVKQAILAAKADWDGLSKLQQKQKGNRQGSVQKAA